MAGQLACMMGIDGWIESSIASCEWQWPNCGARDRRGSPFKTALTLRVGTMILSTLLELHLHERLSPTRSWPTPTDIRAQPHRVNLICDLYRGERKIQAPYFNFNGHDRSHDRDRGKVTASYLAEGDRSGKPGRWAIENRCGRSGWISPRISYS
jgi:hypothetical protein